LPPGTTIECKITLPGGPTPPPTGGPGLPPGNPTNPTPPPGSSLPPITTEIKPTVNIPMPNSICWFKVRGIWIPMPCWK
jgi:hypothetical protein